MTKIHRLNKQKKQRVLAIHRKAKYKTVDRLTYIAAIVEPAITIPQVIVIFRDKTAAGIAISSLFGAQIFTLVWLWYGIIHKEKVIVLYQIGWLVLQTLIIIGGLKYGAKWY